MGGTCHGAADNTALVVSIPLVVSITLDMSPGGLGGTQMVRQGSQCHGVFP